MGVCRAGLPGHVPRVESTSSVDTYNTRQPIARYVGALYGRRRKVAIRHLKRVSQRMKRMTFWQVPDNRKPDSA